MENRKFIIDLAVQEFLFQRENFAIKNGLNTNKKGIRLLSEDFFDLESRIAGKHTFVKVVK